MPAYVSFIRRLFAIIWVLHVLVSGTAVAQSTFGSITGVITDPQGAIVPGATVTVTNRQTEAVRTSVTGGDGTFLIPNLDAGNYRIAVSLSGFADLTRDVTLLARQVLRIDSQLSLAGATEQISVTARRESSLKNRVEEAPGGAGNPAPRRHPRVSCKRVVTRAAPLNGDCVGGVTTV